MIFWSSSHKINREKILFDSSFIVVIITTLIMEPRKSVMALKYVHLFHKIQQGDFPLFVNFTPGNLKYMDMTDEHGNFPLFQTKRILDIVVLYSFSNNGVEILHFT